MPTGTTWRESLQEKETLPRTPGLGPSPHSQSPAATPPNLEGSCRSSPAASRTAWPPTAGRPGRALHSPGCRHHRAGSDRNCGKRTENGDQSGRGPGGARRRVPSSPGENERPHLSWEPPTWAGRCPPTFPFTCQLRQRPYLLNLTHLQVLSHPTKRACLLRPRPPPHAPPTSSCPLTPRPSLQRQLCPPAGSRRFRPIQNQCCSWNSGSDSLRHNPGVRTKETGVRGAAAKHAPCPLEL